MRPEDYWINLGENVIGLDVIADGEKARQAATYQTIAAFIMRIEVDNVLDVGANYGTLVKWLREFTGPPFEGYYWGIDSNPFAVEIGTNISQGNLRSLPYPDKDWSCVVVKDVIEHLESIEPLREAFRVSRRYVIVATYLPWHDAPSVIVQHPDGYYTNTYNRTEIVALAKDCGFGLVEDVWALESNGTPNEVTLWERE